MLEVLRCTYPNVEFSLGGAIGEHDTVVQAMASAALEVAGFKSANFYHWVTDPSALWPGGTINFFRV
jgi:hypothetical protein